MSTVGTFRDLVAWQKAMDLVTQCYALCRTLPRSEQYGLVSQIQRAAVSVPADIAEGRGRHGAAEYLHHLSIAYGSLMELETLIEVVVRVELADAATTAPAVHLAGEVGRVLLGLIRSLRERPQRSC